MHANDPLGAGCRESNLIDIQPRRVGCQQRALLGIAVNLSENVLLELQLLVRRFDHEVGIGDVLEVQRRRDTRQPLLDLALARATACGRRLPVLAHHTETSLEVLRVLLDQRHGDTGIRQYHAYAASHGACANYCRAADVDHGRIGRQAGNLGRLTLGEKEVALGFGLFALEQLGNELSLARDARVEWQVDGRFDRRDGDAGREKSSALPRD